MSKRVRGLCVWGLLLSPGALLAWSSTQGLSLAEEKVTIDIEFTDVEEQTLQFIEFYETLKLTPEQERVKRDALLPLPAACCADKSAYTCCCVCNLSRTVWGLTAHLIVDREYSVEQIRAAVTGWIDFVNPDGFSGNACYRGGCMRSFANNGCGGMSPKQIVR